MSSFLIGGKTMNHLGIFFYKAWKVQNKCDLNTIEAPIDCFFLIKNLN